MKINYIKIKRMSISVKIHNLNYNIMCSIVIFINRKIYFDMSYFPKVKPGHIKTSLESGAMVTSQETCEEKGRLESV